MNSDKIEEVLKTMSIDEKAKLLVGADFWHTYPFLHQKGLCLTDGPHGLRMQKNGGQEAGLKESTPATCFPTASSLACSFDMELLYKVGKAIGEECLEQEVDMLLGPGVNIKRSPLCGRSFEYYAEDPYLAGKLASGFIRGVQSQGVFSCVKHFACNNQEYARLVNDSIVDERALYEIYLKPFQIAIQEAKPKAVMCSYNKVNGVLASENPQLLKKILREDFRFTGTVISDWGAVSNRVKSLKAGLDLEMPGSLSYYDIIAAVFKNELSMEVVDEAATAVLKLYQERPSFEKTLKIDHHELAKEAAVESIVLLKNENQVLPLSKDERVGILGSYQMRIQGAGSSKVNPKRVDSFLDSLEALGASYQVFEQITEELKQMDKILYFVGLSSNNEIEGKDKTDLKLDPVELQKIEELSKLHSKVIVILTTGSVVELPFLNSISGLVLTYLAGEAAASACCDILYNQVNPSGHLAETWIEKLEDSPCKEYGRDIYQTFYKESMLVGYRYYDWMQIRPTFPFGFGLSYTTFEFYAMEIGSKQIHLNIKNTGSYYGKIVAQLYVRYKGNAVIKPIRELKAFQKIGLAPLEERQISFPIEDSFFEYYDTTSHKFVLCEGAYTLEIGTSSRNILLSKEYLVEGKEPQYSDGSYFKFKSIEDITKKDYEAYYHKELPALPRKYPFTLDSPMVETQSKWIGRVFIYFGLKALKKRSQSEEEYEMNKYTFLTGPIRMMGMGLKKTNHQLEGIVDILNGKILSGAIRFLKKDKCVKRKREIS